MSVTAAFRCPQCAASVDLPEDRLSDACAFCEAPLVRAEAGAAEAVDLVAPFDLDGRQAAQRLAHYLSRHHLAPEALRRASAPEELRGVLVPFWVYNAHAHSTWSAQVGIYWYETRTKVVFVNGKMQTRTETVRHTEWHGCQGTHVHAYDDHLVSGSTGLEEGEANELEPFDLGRARAFDAALLAGQIAERPSVSHEQAHQTAAEELAQAENREIGEFLPGDTSRGLTNQTRVDIQSVRLALLPVWVATWTWKGEVLRLLVNGQTGEVVGKVPRSWTKIVLLVVALLVVLVLALGCVGLFGTVVTVLERGGLL